MTKTASLFKIIALTLIFAAFCTIPVAFGQTPPANQTTVELAMLKGQIVDDANRAPMEDVKVRLIGFEGETLTNARGEFFLEAPADNYAGIVVELTGEGEMKLLENEIALNPGQFLNLEEIVIEPLIEKEPLNLPQPDAFEPRTKGAGIDAAREAVLNADELGMARETAETVNLMAMNAPDNRTPASAPTLDNPDFEIHPLLLQARAMTADGNFFGANRAYEEYMALFPMDGPVAVEYGLMVFHNIQNAEGRTLLKEAAKLPGLRPIDIDAINRYLVPPVVIVDEPRYERPHVHIRLRHRHRACH